MLVGVAGCLIERLDRFAQRPGGIPRLTVGAVRVAHRHGCSEQPAQRGAGQKDAVQQRIRRTAARAGQIQLLDCLGGAGRAPLEQRERVKIVVTGGAIQRAPSELG
ncbi:MAG: hypothetical protein ABSG43_28065 [Solirubrobacteraceae bacterium]